MMKRIVAFIEDDTADGGLGMVFRNLMWYAKDHYRVLYMSTRENNGRIPADVEYIQFHEQGEFVPHTNGLKRSVSSILPLRKELSRHKVDLAVSFGFYSNVRTSLASMGTGTKVLVSERGNAQRFKGVSRLLLGTVLFQADTIVFQSHAAQSAYPGVLRKKGTVIYNAIFKNNELPDCSEMQWDNRIVSVGRIHPDKNFALLLKAFALVLQKRDDVLLEIYGEEEPGSPQPYLQQLKELAVELRATDQVHFMGQTKDVGAAISGARLFVLSSVLEGMPNALIEAMACGLPCITTDFMPRCAGEIVKNGVDGIISTREDEVKLAEDICTMLNRPEESRQMARNAVKIRERLSTNVIFNQWRQAFDDTMAGR